MLLCSPPSRGFIQSQEGTKPTLGFGPNDIGKTTLLNAIYWCYYGTTPRGLKSGDVVNWGAKSCSVTTSSTIGDESLIIKRTQSPNSLTLNGKPIDQPELLKHLRIGPKAFTYAIMIPQFGDSFFDLSPSEKLTLFSEILELDYWLDKSREADTLAKELLNERESKEKLKATFRGRN